ncbi:MAG: rhodanese-like domain-containing protein [Burkholderiales bacterium]|jgi:phage shock protein E|nr:rhodanese-like domain-containing protein [Burkholderiales bacterium]
MRRPRGCELGEEMNWKCWLGTVVVALGLGVMNALAAGPTFLIDVRTPKEFAEGHLVGAVNIEYQEIVARVGSVTLDKNARIELYCRSGRRSGIAQGSLKDAGYQNAVNLGGFEELKKTRPATQ